MNLMLKDRAYNFVKKLVEVIIPAASALYFGLSKIWGFPEAENVVGSSALLVVFLSTVLGISRNTYEKSGAAYDGEMVVEESEAGKTLFNLVLNGDPEELESMDSVSFKVKKPEARK